MEAIFFLIDIIAVIWLLFWSIVNDRRGPGVPTSGLFAYRESGLHRRAMNSGSTSRPKSALTPRKGR